ncbi:MAG: DUF4148 domain-containing protein [Stagnimonas sp.]|nr:DUF4148 domain-containing protein [Stagnimonas sp.]
MLIRTPMAVLVLAMASVPAFASGTIHSATTEMGYTVHPNHAQAGKSRSEVLAEIEQSKKDGSWNFHRLGVPLPVKSSTPALTREQVLAELERAQKHPTWAARRVGAAVTMP